MAASSNRGYVFSLVLSAACWGLATVMTKGVLKHIPPLTLLVVQLAASVVSLWVAVALRRLRLPPLRQALRLGLTGLLEPGLAYTLGLLGLALTTASMATLIWAAEPILILGLAWLILRERLTRPLMAFSAFALMGVVLVVGMSPDADQSSSVLGNALTLVGVGCCALYVVLTRRIVADLDPLLLAALQQTLAWVWALLIWPLEWLRGQAAALGAIDPTLWAWAAVSGLVYYALAFWLYITGLKKTPASLAGLFFNLIPIFGVGGGYIFLGERLGAAQWVGAITIIAAVIGVFRLHRTEPAPAL